MFSSFLLIQLSQSQNRLLFLSESSGLSMNILHVGDKSPMQQGFFTNSVGNLLPPPRLFWWAV